MELYIGRSKGKQVWRWRYFWDEDVIAKSAEGYLDTSINAAVMRIQKNIHKYEVDMYRGRDGKYYWRMKANNGNIVAVCDGGYKGSKECSINLNRFIDTVPRAAWVKIHNRKPFKRSNVRIVDSKGEL